MEELEEPAYTGAAEDWRRGWLWSWLSLALTAPRRWEYGTSDYRRSGNACIKSVILFGKGSLHGGNRVMDREGPRLSARNPDKLLQEIKAG